MARKQHYTRREFIRNSLIFMSGVTFAPAFLARTVSGGISSPSLSEQRVLIVVQLGGGNDGLNTVVPYRMDAYYRYRHRLAIPSKRVLPLDDTVGLNPALEGLKTLYDEGKVAIVQGVGYPNPSRSHFRSMDIWHTARPESKNTDSGWLGRFLDRACREGSPPVQGVQFGFSRNLALEGQKNYVTTILDTHLMGWQPIPTEQTERDTERQTFFKTLKFQVQNEEIEYVTHITMDLIASSEWVQQASQRGRTRAKYPATSFGRQLQSTASLILGGMPSMIYYTHLDGFDTHVNQQGRHDRLLEELDRGLRAFFEDIGHSRYRSRVLVLIFSEFGRRVEENASGGTDHGTVNPVILLGDTIQPGLYGTHPSLDRSHLDNIGDPRYRIDFRSVYATILQQWFKTEPAKILGHPFPTFPLITNTKAAPVP